MTNSISIPQTSLRYGIMAGILMILYFFLCNALGWQANQLVRFSSHVFTVVAVFLAIRAFKAQAAGPAPYLSGLALGFLVGLVGSVLFAAFILLYANMLNPTYQQDLQSQSYFGTQVGSLALAGAITLLGTMMGSLTGYILMMSDGTDGRRRTGTRDHG